mmetsp:Transcript_25450/g.50073  ORF Transcript_25450/g.50073 Transcript_25450/m.50073 type:complete len:928 (-) Transcript_25450:127-2910(-)|eukprot:CAMPEP_0175123330 /NCGR_PEP_ID=MMETSP0087-20121206/2186_1 /TAXON_ID=136419 /ORGANISM="Unknown Unknown, Strain D1" /LENGTH=927 /DNA_ID=CAMNT_0016405015 /DNA_START=59 /DNA_END=2842 /DNA_ORIENTATION=+
MSDSEKEEVSSDNAEGSEKGDEGEESNNEQEENGVANAEEEKEKSTGVAPNAALLPGDTPTQLGSFFTAKLADAAPIQFSASSFQDPPLPFAPSLPNPSTTPAVSMPLSSSWQALDNMKNMTLDFSQLIHLVPIVRECLQRTEQGAQYTKQSFEHFAAELRANYQKDLSLIREEHSKQLAIFKSELGNELLKVSTRQVEVEKSVKDFVTKHSEMMTAKLAEQDEMISSIHSTLGAKADRSDILAKISLKADKLETDDAVSKLKSQLSQNEAKLDVLSREHGKIVADIQTQNLAEQRTFNEKLDRVVQDSKVVSKYTVDLQHQLDSFVKDFKVLKKDLSQLSKTVSDVATAAPSAAPSTPDPAVSSVSTPSAPVTDTAPSASIGGHTHIHIHTGSENKAVPQHPDPTGNSDGAVSGAAEESPPGFNDFLAESLENQQTLREQVQVLQSQQQQCMQLLGLEDSGSVFPPVTANLHSELQSCQNRLKSVESSLMNTEETIKRNLSHTHMHMQQLELFVRQTEVKIGSVMDIPTQVAQVKADIGGVKIDTAQLGEKLLQYVSVKQEVDGIARRVREIESDLDNTMASREYCEEYCDQMIEATYSLVQALQTDVKALRQSAKKAAADKKPSSGEPKRTTSKDLKKQKEEKESSRTREKQEKQDITQTLKSSKSKSSDKPSVVSTKDPTASLTNANKAVKKKKLLGKFATAKEIDREVGKKLEKNKKLFTLRKGGLSDATSKLTTESASFKAEEKSDQNFVEPREPGAVEEQKAAQKVDEKKEDVKDEVPKKESKKKKAPKKSVPPISKPPPKRLPKPEEPLPPRGTPKPSNPSSKAPPRPVSASPANKKPARPSAEASSPARPRSASLRKSGGWSSMSQKPVDPEDLGDLKGNSFRLQSRDSKEEALDKKKSEGKKQSLQQEQAAVTQEGEK